MKTLPHRRPSAAMIVALIALCLGLGGSAIAAGDLTKSQVKKIAKKQATKVLNQKASGLSVANATNATNAVNATTADSTKAYAYVSSDGTVSLAKNIASANVSNPSDGVYCLDLPFNPNGGQANVAADSPKAWFIYVEDADGPNGLFECPAGAEFEVNVYNDSFSLIDGSFYVSLYQ